VSSNRERQRICDIVDNIIAAQSYIGTLAAAEFSSNQMAVDAVERCLQRITEAVVKLGRDRFAVLAPKVSFDEVRGLGNRLRHEYDMLDDDVVFNTVTQSLPILLAYCQGALDQ
jgi:uncharacterized protein with HEPN domain